MPDASTGRPVAERVPPGEVPVPVPTAEDLTLGRLRGMFPLCDIWAVHPVCGPVSWSARRKGQAAAEVITTDQDTLVFWLEGSGDG
jgi:hypothetical protein